MLKNIKYKVFGVIFLAIFCGTISAQDIIVKAKMDSVAMLIGHQTKLTLEMTKPKDADVAFPLILDTLVDKVEVLDRSAIDTNLIGNDREQLIQEFTVTCFDSGFYYIPPFQFEIQPASGGGTLETNPLMLKMYTYQIDSIAGVFDIKPVKKIKITFKEVLPYLLWWAGISIFILTAIALYWKFKKKKPIFSGPPKPVEPPYVTAFRELERIKMEKLWQKGEEKQYFTDLTDTLRDYLEGRYNIVTWERTSDEILEDIKDVLEKEHYKKIEAMLQLSDLVKFAKLKPLMDESERCIKDVYAFVDETKFVPEEEEKEELDSVENEGAEDQEKKSN